jgi:tRNA dimethylallyltransferase
VKGLMDAGVSAEFLYKLGLEYRWIYQYLNGEMSYDEMVEGLGNAIKKFAKRQMTWFRRDKDILWLDMAGDPVKQASAAIDAFLEGAAR